MSFLEFFVRNAEYTNISSMWGLYRVLLWLIVKLLTMICNTAEQIYKHIFSLFGVIYSKPVVDFFRGWISYLWIPIAISILILAYNLILGDSSEGNTKVKAFARNLALLFIVLFGLPYIFIGHANNDYAGVFVNSKASYYTEASDTYGKTPQQVDGLFWSSDSGLIDLFVNDSGQGIIKGVSALGGSEDKSYTYSIVANNIYDLEGIFFECTKLDRNSFTKTWSRDILESGKIYKNEFQTKKSNGTYSGTTNDEIMSINIAESEDYDTWDAMEYGENARNKNVSDFMVPNYDDATALDGIITTMWFTNGDEEKASRLLAAQTPAKDFLFKYMLSPSKVEHDSNGKTTSFGLNAGAKTKADLPFGWKIKFLNSELFRYHIEWGILFIQLIAMIIVLLLTSYKIAKIIYEIIFDHFLAIFYGAADLSNGQRIKEVLQSIVNLLISLLFAVVSVELYLIITESLNTITFIADDPHMNKWMIALINFFLAMAVVKGPSVLEKIMGIEGGLSGAWRDMGAATRPAKHAAIVGGYMAAKGAAKLGSSVAKRGYYKYNKHKGKTAARKENANGNQYKIGSGKDKSRKEVAGNESQFSAIKATKSKNSQSNTAANGKAAANSEMARQGRDISESMKKNIDVANSGRTGKLSESDKQKNTDAVVNETANRYRGNIQNSALAEKAKARINGEKISDKEALTRAYEGSGFSAEQAESLAARDIAGGSFMDKKEKFENSISVKAQQNIEDSPLNYNNKMEAYKDAATEHYKALGFDNETASSMATETANKVLIDDSQHQIRARASEIQRAASDDANRMSDIEALRLATHDVIGASTSVGFTGNINDAADYIYSQGTLREGVVSGRIANNTVRERAETNTRAGSLMSNSVIETEALLHGGFQSQRNVHSLRSKGYETGYSKVERKASRKTEKNYQKLKKERKNNE